VPNPFYHAERVLNELGIRDPTDLQDLKLIAWERQAIVKEKHLDGAEAVLTLFGSRAIITISTTVTNHQRRRFSIAHEIGHLEMHRQSSSLTLCMSEDIDERGFSSSRADLEQEANQFASAFLLPEQFFAPLCQTQPPSLDHVATLADTFNVSLTATALRYLLFCEEPVAVVYSQDGYVNWFQGSEFFQELNVFIDVKAKLDPSSRAVGFFQGRSIEASARQVNASAWFASGDYRDDARIWEQSWAMPTYNAVLTLLWVEEDIEEEDILGW
jgi:Zn-dependent peptidase ImmA (M78 family)